MSWHRSGLHKVDITTKKTTTTTTNKGFCNNLYEPPKNGTKNINVGFATTPHITYTRPLPSLIPPHFFW